jgi:hypothetical protein
MARPCGYHGEGTIIEISQDGHTFTKLPPSRDGDSTVIKCLISYLKLEPDRFILHLKNQS